METGLRKELNKRKNGFQTKNLSKFFGITPDGFVKKVRYNRFSVEEAIALITTFYKPEEINFDLLVYLFTYQD